MDLPILSDTPTSKWQAYNQQWPMTSASQDVALSACWSLLRRENLSETKWLELLPIWNGWWWSLGGYPSWTRISGRWAWILNAGECVLWPRVWNDSQGKLYEQALGLIDGRLIDTAEFELRAWQGGQLVEGALPSGRLPRVLATGLNIGRDKQGWSAGTQYQGWRLSEEGCAVVEPPHPPSTQNLLPGWNQLDNQGNFFQHAEEWSSLTDDSRMYWRVWIGASVGSRTIFQRSLT